MTTTELALARTATSRRYRLGVMGGTFDPIHHGHLVAASEVAAKFELDEVVFVPTGMPWQKSHREVSLAEDRYLMTVIATASNPRFSVSRVDIDRPGNTYTVDTLKDLRAERGDNTDLFSITAADAGRQILTWSGAYQLSEIEVARHLMLVLQRVGQYVDLGRVLGDEDGERARQPRPQVAVDHRFPLLPQRGLGGMPDSGFAHLRDAGVEQALGRDLTGTALTDNR